MHIYNIGTGVTSSRVWYNIYVEALNNTFNYWNIQYQVKYIANLILLNHIQKRGNIYR